MSQLAVRLVWPAQRERILSLASDRSHNLATAAAVADHMPRRLEPEEPEVLAAAAAVAEELLRTARRLALAPLAALDTPSSSSSFKVSRSGDHPSLD
jgi:hypothetical protein